jgi:hypothetical protein
MKMTKKVFNQTIKDLWGNIDLMEAWETYNETLMTMASGEERDIDILSMLLTLDKGQRLLWRTSLAEAGYEMTPIQVDQYISIVGLAVEV